MMDLVPVGGDALGRLRKRLQKIEKFYALWEKWDKPSNREGIELIAEKLMELCWLEVLVRKLSRSYIWMSLPGTSELRR